MAEDAKDSAYEWALRVLKAEVNNAQYDKSMADYQIKLDKAKAALSEALAEEKRDPVMVEVLTKRVKLYTVEVARQIAIKHTAEEKRKKTIESFRRADTSANSTHYGAV